MQKQIAVVVLLLDQNIIGIVEIPVLILAKGSPAGVFAVAVVIKQIIYGNYYSGKILKRIIRGDIYFNPTGTEFVILHTCIFQNDFDLACVICHDTFFVVGGVKQIFAV